MKNIISFFVYGFKIGIAEITVNIAFEMYEKLAVAQQENGDILTKIWQVLFNRFCLLTLQ